MKIKICGLTRKTDIDYVNELLPDMVGFILVSGRRRYVTPEMAKKLITGLKPEISSVGVFLNESPSVINEICDVCSPDFIQLHGNEDNEYINVLRKTTGLPIIKAFKVRNVSDVIAAENSSADLILLDAGEGGGKAFEWTLANSMTRPYLLAGGLNCENIGKAIEELSPYGIDISSGVETEGFKDYKKIEKIIKTCRNQN